MLTLVALLTLVSVATGAIPDGSYTVTPCSCTGSCTAAICGITVAEGGSKWKTNTHYTFSDGKYCDIIDNGRYSYSGSEVTMTSIGTPTASGDGSLTHSCQWDPYSVFRSQSTIPSRAMEWCP